MDLEFAIDPQWLVSNQSILRIRRTLFWMLVNVKRFFKAQVLASETSLLRFIELTKGVED